MNEQVKEQIQKKLRRVTEEVLEKLAFIFSFPATDRGVPADDQGLLDRSEAVTSVVTFSGPFKGSIGVVISKESLPDLAGNMLGIDMEDTTEEQRGDALKELVNVICGNLLPVIAGKRTIFDVGAPQIISDEPFGEEPVGISKMSLEKGECDIYLFIEGEIPEDIFEEIMEADPETEEDTPEADEEDWGRFSSDDLDSF